MGADIYKGDIGIKIILDVGLDISAATITQIYYRKPGGDGGSWTAVIESGNTSISYTSLSGDFDEVGVWKLQAHVVTPSWTQNGEIANVNVRPSL